MRSIQILALFLLLCISSSSTTDSDSPTKKNILKKILGRFEKKRNANVSVDDKDKSIDGHVCTADEENCLSKTVDAQDASQNAIDETDMSSKDLSGKNDFDNTSTEGGSKDKIETSSTHHRSQQQSDQNQNPCQDLHTNCATWSTQIDPITNLSPCKTNSAYMSHYCAQSCEACELTLIGRRLSDMAARSGHVPSICSNDQFDCSKWATEGECVNNPYYMNAWCRSSCGLCSEESNYFGAGQRLPTEKKQALAITEQRIQETIQYMKVVNSSGDSSARSKCLNRHQDCTYWWTLGECTINSEYMNLFCAPTCQTCHLIDEFDS